MDYCLTYISIVPYTYPVRYCNRRLVKNIIDTVMYKMLLDKRPPHPKIKRWYQRTAQQSALGPSSTMSWPLSGLAHNLHVHTTQVMPPTRRRQSAMPQTHGVLVYSESICRCNFTNSGRAFSSRGLVFSS
jgi:hypothetical protein